jgi:uncharacterized protein (DUF433 family)
MVLAERLSFLSRAFWNCGDVFGLALLGGLATPLTFGDFRPYGSIMDYEKYITIESGKRGGKPCIRGLRITVYDVLDYLTSGMTEAEILRDFPDLTNEDIRACLAFAADRERKLITIPM